MRESVEDKVGALVGVEFEDTAKEAETKAQEPPKNRASIVTSLAKGASEKTKSDVQYVPGAAGPEAKAAKSKLAATGEDAKNGAVSAEKNVGEKMTAKSDVEKALAQRYERGKGVDKRGVNEILAERYKPIDERDDTKLRGL